MRIHLLSDLHLEIHPFEPVSLAADVVVLAGDIDVKARGVDWARESFSCPVLYVPGNHEYYGGHLQRTLHTMRSASDDRVRVLDREEFCLGGVRFLGATMWSDFAATGNPPLASLAAQEQMNDYRKIRTGDYRRIRPADLHQRAIETREWLSARLAEPFGGRTVVITHHAPSLQSLHGSPHVGTHLDASYANRWEALMGGDRVALWMHGHSHMAVDYAVQGTQVVCNPRGYPGERTGFNASLILTV